MIGKRVICTCTINGVKETISGIVVFAIRDKGIIVSINVDCGDSRVERVKVNEWDIKFEE